MTCGYRKLMMSFRCSERQQINLHPQRRRNRTVALLVSPAAACLIVAPATLAARTNTIRVLQSTSHLSSSSLTFAFFPSLSRPYLLSSVGVLLLQSSHSSHYLVWNQNIVHLISMRKMLLAEEAHSESQLARGPRVRLTVDVDRISHTPYAACLGSYLVEDKSYLTIWKIEYLEIVKYTPRSFSQSWLSSVPFFVCTTSLYSFVAAHLASVSCNYTYHKSSRASSQAPFLPAF